jgi:NAD-dependent dihydropyrimidine dehydrogenase PreA subunit
MYMVDEEQCNGCGVCVDLCPAEAIRVRNDAAEIDGECCSDCGACFDACLHGAIFELHEPREITSTGQPAYVADSAPSFPEKASSSHVPAAMGKSKTPLVAAFPVLLKLAGSLAEYLSARSRKESDVCRRSPASDYRRVSSRQGRHRRRGR